MISHPPPSFGVGDVATTIRAEASQPDFRKRIEDARANLAAAEADYQRHAASHRLNEVPVDSTAHGFDSAESVRLYEYRLLEKPCGRQHYEEILASSTKCLLCGCGRATTVDHFLPKSRYPNLTVCPINLIPACKDCNYAKSDSPADSPTYLHPYFVSLEDVEVVATQQNSSPASIEFSIAGDASTPVVASARFHFRELGLSSIYQFHALHELPTCYQQYSRIYDEQGAAGVAHFLRTRATSAKARERHGWRQAAYLCWSRSPDFCEQGWQIA